MHARETPGVRARVEGCEDSRHVRVGGKECEDPRLMPGACVLFASVPAFPCHVRPLLGSLPGVREEGAGMGFVGRSFKGEVLRVRVQR